jgi:RimJ/RimL family protein N-acetyltransferase
VPFVPPQFDVPPGIETEAFCLEPLTVEHVEVDFAALMSSRETLREWSGSDWPSDEFTLEENRDDLERHDREHRQREAFTFTVLAPDRERCLGCVYLTPLRWEAEANRNALGEVGEDEAVVGFWVIDEQRRVALDRRLLAALRTWLAGWPFASVSFAAAIAHRHQIGLFEDAGLRPRAEITVTGRTGIFRLYT